MSVYISIYLYIYISHAYTCTGMYICIYIYMYVHTHTCMYDIWWLPEGYTMAQVHRQRDCNLAGSDPEHAPMG